MNICLQKSGVLHVKNNVQTVLQRNIIQDFDPNRGLIKGSQPINDFTKQTFRMNCFSYAIRRACAQCSSIATAPSSRMYTF